MTEPRYDPSHEAAGKPAAAVAWLLYILSIPSANLLVILGLLVAYAARSGATGVARQHLDTQIRFFWSVFWWTIGLWILMIVSFLSVIGILLGFVFLGLLFLLSLWFTVKSVLGLFNLLQDRPA
ncbi:hypothetical protein [Brevundimonas sp.]|uniref:hypothetical protein n=1 Tax=Brevundimonas sp. TaxID=1871086 RepID=UPI0022BB28DB|nr:hypothetical protein [Brevundimonas sp.]MCZ8193955.1 hypothetical protein [Brevundimonas sp.]